VSRTRYRILFSLLGLSLGALVVGAVILAPSGRAPNLPSAVESFSPADGAIVLRQTALEVDLLAGYSMSLVVDGQAIPPTEISFTEATGKYVFLPAPDKTVTEWFPGFHVVEITFDRAIGLPDPGSLRWSFRTQ